jgi:hypothetical protein
MTIDILVERFHELMSNRAVSIVVMLAGAAGAVVSIAGGYYITYRLVTLIGAS